MPVFVNSPGGKLLSHDGKLHGKEEK
jgi:hypothetical protein